MAATSTETSITPAAGAMARQDFSGSEMAVAAETSSTAIAAQAKAAVEARYVLALRRPRNLDVVRVSILKECKRPRFAEVARYRKPIGGGKIEGWSIRFAESALRCYGNAYPEITTVYDDAEKRIVRVSLTDLESNTTWSKDVVIEKTVERRQVKPGMEVLGSRQNSGGQTVYIVKSTDDDLLNKENSLVSKAIRNHILRIIPGDLLDEALEQVTATLKEGAKADPDAARKKLVDAFTSVGVPPDALANYVGHELGHLQPAELDDLRAIYAALVEGETNWRQVMDAKVAASGQESGEVKDQPAAQTKTEALKAKLKKGKEQAPAAAANADEPPADVKLPTLAENQKVVAEGKSETGRTVRIVDEPK